MASQLSWFSKTLTAIIAGYMLQPLRPSISMTSPIASLPLPSPLMVVRNREHQVLSPLIVAFKARDRRWSTSLTLIGLCLSPGQKGLKARDQRCIVRSVDITAVPTAKRQKESSVASEIDRRCMPLSLCSIYLFIYFGFILGFEFKAGIPGNDSFIPFSH